jgi:triacylglycerol lipase
LPSNTQVNAELIYIKPVVNGNWRCVVVGTKNVLHAGIALSLLAGCGQVPQLAVTKLPARTTQALAVSDWTRQVQSLDAAAFAEHDVDGDGVLTPRELPALPHAAFAALDINHDGHLTPQEAGSLAPAMNLRVKMAMGFDKASRSAQSTGEPLGIEAPGSQLLGNLGREALTSRIGNPVLFVPGYLDLKLYFAILQQRSRAEGRDTTYVELFPNIGDIRVAAVMLKTQIDSVRARTGATKVDLIAHSEGGLISRYYIQNLMNGSAVDRLVTLATPNHGTVVGYLGPGMGARQMQPGSDFLTALNTPDCAPAGVKVTSIRAGMDEIIVPHDSPILNGAENELVPVAEHASIFVLPRALNFVAGGMAR